LPSASAPFVLRASLIAHEVFALRYRRADAAASTASHPNVRDDREPPLLWGGMRGKNPQISEKQKRFIFREGTGQEFENPARRANQSEEKELERSALRRFLSLLRWPRRHRGLLSSRLPIQQVTLTVMCAVTPGCDRLTGKILDQVGVGSIPGKVLTHRVRFAIRATCVDLAGGHGILARLVDGAASAGAAAALATDGKGLGIVGIC
jgi:hypothetical protein